MKPPKLLFFILTAFLSWASAADETSNYAKLREKITGLELTNQDGKQVQFYEDLVKDRITAVNFVFADCPGICPPLGAKFGEVQGLLGDKLGKEIGLITVSVFPEGDTPEKMKAWGAKFGARPGWSLLTDKSGKRAKIDQILKALKVYTPDFEDHSPFMLLMDDRNESVERMHGIATDAAKVKEKLFAMSAAEKAKPKPVSRASAAAQRYFKDLPLTDQSGETRHFYSDLIKGKVVVIGSFFASCKGVCPVIMSNLERLQNSLGEKMGKDVHFISLTVDPLIDTPEALNAYATRFNAKPGWYFLTGDQEQLGNVLAQLNYKVENREAHSNVLFIGNEPTGLWVKTPENLAKVLAKVLDDPSAQAAAVPLPVNSEQ